jgi:quinoprotein glucose dehydrogenase
MRSTLANTMSRALPLFLLAAAAFAQQGARDGEWHHYGGDKGSTKYSSLDQIARANVANLEIAWTWEATIDQQVEPRVLGAGHLKATPVMAGGVLYLTTPLQQVVALDAGTGAQLWVFDPQVYKQGRPVNSGWQHRGVEYWSDGERRRIFVANGARQLLSLDAATGKLDPAFGVAGIVDTTKGIAREIRYPNEYGHNAPPIVCAGTLVLGSIVSDGPTRKEMPPGDLRGYDPVTGALRWTFHTVPQEGEPGVETWQDESWRYTGNTNAWSMLSCDDALGMVYAPIGTPTNDWYGGHRKGDGLYAESLLALDAKTGVRVWHFQAVHHGVWDYDFPAAPNLVDIEVEGKTIPAVAQVSKQGFTYVFDRRTGEPVWPIEERPVPQSTVPGEQTWPTQPFPTKPPPFERQGITEDDLIDFTPELRAEALRIVADYVLGPIFTPPIVVGEGGKKAVLMLPSAAGGANWRGAAIDPETGVLYVPSMTLAMELGLSKPDAARSEFDYVYGADFLPQGPQGLPLVKPPYGRITAIDLNRGEHLWQVAEGAGPKDHPAIAHLDLPDLGNSAHGVLSNGGMVLTKTLLFSIQAAVNESSLMRMGDHGWVRAFDKSNGEKVWEHELSPTPHGTPMTYLHEGRQYLVVATGGLNQKATLVAFALPR